MIKARILKFCRSARISDFALESLLGDIRRDFSEFVTLGYKKYLKLKKCIILLFIINTR